jgi:Fe-S cluster assembly protein SufD
MGVYLARGDQHLDNTTVIDHLKPGSTSKEIYKGVIDDEATGVFQGRIVVHPNAQQTDAHQLNRNMLLSPKAHADAKPELLIYADDVKCSHGATVGDLEADALFYLRARGIPEAEARNLLIEGFIEEMVDRVVHPVMRDYLENMVATWLGHPRHQ